MADKKDDPVIVPPGHKHLEGEIKAENIDAEFVDAIDGSVNQEEDYPEEPKLYLDPGCKIPAP